MRQGSQKIVMPIASNASLVTIDQEDHPQLNMYDSTQHNPPN